MTSHSPDEWSPDYDYEDEWGGRDGGWNDAEETTATTTTTPHFLPVQPAITKYINHYDPANPLQIQVRWLVGGPLGAMSHEGIFTILGAKELPVPGLVLASQCCFCWIICSSKPDKSLAEHGNGTSNAISDVFFYAFCHLNSQDVIPLVIELMSYIGYKRMIFAIFTIHIHFS